jgi:hypothetical protein
MLVRSRGVSVKRFAKFTSCALPRRTLATWPDLQDTLHTGDFFLLLANELDFFLNNNRKDAAAQQVYDFHQKQCGLLLPLRITN